MNTIHLTNARGRTVGWVEFGPDDYVSHAGGDLEFMLVKAYSRQDVERYAATERMHITSAIGDSDGA